MAKKISKSKVPIGEQLRTHRIEVLKKGLREMAGLLEISPPHLTDIEKGNRTPSQDLLVRISAQYGVEEAVLRAAWERADVDVGRITNKSAITSKMVPALLRTAEDMSPEEWERLLKAARKIAGKEKDAKD